MSKSNILFSLNKYPIFIVCLAFILTACGGGGGDGDTSITPPNNPPPPSPPPPVQTGIFKDLDVSGLSFSSGAESGVTDASGRYTCETGALVFFNIGKVALGSAECSTLTTPNQLVTDNATFDLKRANIARFIQMLDMDGDPNNGIEISALVRQAADNWAQVDFLTADLDTDLVTIIADAASVDGTPHALPTEQQALAHLDETLDCAYAGAYAGTHSGTYSGAAGLVIGWGGAGLGYLPLSFEWEAFDSTTEVEQFGGGGNSITIRQLPEIDHSDPNFAGPITAQFTTPDSISGMWEGGAVQFTRIGGDDGSEYRLVGKAESFSVSDRAAAYISVNYDGTNISGQVFGGTIYSVTGTVTGNAVSLKATGGGETLTGTGNLSVFPDGSPDEAQGTFSDGSTFSLVACRLN